jgi:hypothetical protein
MSENSGVGLHKLNCMSKMSDNLNLLYLYLKFSLLDAEFQTELIYVTS